MTLNSDFHTDHLKGGRFNAQGFGALAKQPRTPGWAQRGNDFYTKQAKGALDALLVLLAAPIIIPVIAVLCLLIACKGGKPFYVQDRVGRNGKIYKIWKLRTMRVDADATLEAYLASNSDARREWDSTQKIKKDPRITPIGHILRKTSLDELPQLWNVLKGEMSLVGPRPMMPQQKDLYHGTAYYRMRPGITGTWQISSRNDSTFAERAAFDDDYARRISLSTDIKVLAATVGVVLRGTGH